jgi:hypothetical protein
VVASASCGPSGPVGPQVVPPVEVPATAPTLLVDVGTGTSEFVELADGDPVVLVSGGQGGYHVWTGVRVHDARITDARINLSARLEDGKSAGPTSSAATSFSVLGDGSRGAAGLRDFIDRPDLVLGKRVVLRVEVIASDQRHGAAEKVVTVRDP